MSTGVVGRLRLAGMSAWPLALASVAVVACYAATLPAMGLAGSASATCMVVYAAALLSSVAGFAFSAICGAMLFQLRHDTVEVVQIMLVCSIANQSLSVWSLRRDISLAALLPYLAGGALGVPAGVWLLLHLQARLYVHGLGALLTAYGAFTVLRKPVVLRRSPRWGDFLSGALGGLMGGFAATPGAAVSIWCGTKGWDKHRQRAVFQPFILAMQLLALGLITGLRTQSSVSYGIPLTAWACVPAGLAGTWGGLTCFRRLSDRQFAFAVNLLLIVSGAGLLL